MHLFQNATNTNTYTAALTVSTSRPGRGQGGFGLSNGHLLVGSLLEGQRDDVPGQQLLRGRHLPLVASAKWRGEEEG